MSFHRYLVSFDARRHAPPVHRRPRHRRRHRRAAGRPRSPGRPATSSSSPRTASARATAAYAQGGIAGVLSPEDRFENHIEDTLTAGAGLCDRGGRRDWSSARRPQQIDDLDPLGHAVRRGGRPARPDPRGRPQPPPHRPRPGRRHRPRGHAGHHRHGPQRRRTSPSGTTPSPSTC